ncbi:nitroreductase family protein [Cryobacterium aureum]|uniref:nitroreductase family protein n=1 Tax=Cryobacterium aureum TaxID=995037 RepID=UPI001374D920|nr:nitroreductase family protein [Cryobacterium aureum]
MEALDLIRTLNARPAVRSFNDRSVPLEVLRQIIEVARWTGSARNRQPWRFIGVSDKELLEKLGALGAYAQHIAAAPCALILLSADNGFQDTEFDLGKVSQTVTLAATALGLGSCLATIYPEANVTKAATLLRVESGWRPHHAISLGYPGAPMPGKRAITTGRLSTLELLSTHRL